MINETGACLWPRAIIDVIPSPGAHIATANILRNFDPDLNQVASRLRLDVTHLQPVMGSPYHIAQHIKRRLGINKSDIEATIGVASDPHIAAFAAGAARTGTIKSIAPWEVRPSLQHEPIESICQLTPELAYKLGLVGIRTGAQIADQPLAVIKRVFGDSGVALWRACRGEINAAALEVDDQYQSIRCRAVLPPRTINRRSINSHLRRVTNSLLSVLQIRQRIPTTIHLSMREQQKVAIEVGALDIVGDKFNPRDLASSVQKVFSGNWHGGALHFVELSAQQLFDPGGQLDMFD
jgi:nucleotidyltransferase/DNA polymerase involved in DNA repair